MLLPSLLSRLSISVAPHRALSTSSALLFRGTPTLFAEPLKKKKRIDPAIIKMREERRRRNIEKQIRRLERNARQPKPIDEIEVPLTLLDTKKQRIRKVEPVTFEVEMQRHALNKEWSKYRNEAKLADVQQIDNLMFAQKKALEELQKESEELYQEAIQPDITFVPFYARGPVQTPPIEKYDSPDGEIVDISKKW